MHSGFLRVRAPRLPGYHHAKLLLILWLSLPRFEGAAMLWSRWVLPLLVQHEARIDARLEEMQQRVEEYAKQGKETGVKALKKGIIMMLFQV